MLMSAVALWATFVVSDHYPPWMAFHGEACAFFSLLTLALGAWRLRARMRVPHEVLIIFAIALVPWGQYAFGLLPFAGTAWLFSIYLCAFALAWCVGALCADATDPFARKAFLIVVLAASVVNAGINLYQALGLDWLGMWVLTVAPGDRSGGNLAQPNHAALLIVVGLLAAVHAFEQRLFGSFTLTVVSVPLIVGLAATQSRAAGLALLWVLSASFLMRRRAGIRFSSWAWGAVAFTVVLLGTVFPGLVTAIMEPSVSVSQAAVSPDRLMVGYRPLHWRILSEAVMERPWLGYGAGGVAGAHTLVGLRHAPVMEWLTYSHSILLDLVVWFGIPLGFVVALISLTWFARRCLQVRSSLQWSVVVAIGCFGVFALLEYPHAYAYFLLPCGVAAGFIGPQRAAFRVPGWAAAGGALWLSVMLAITAVDYIKVETDFRELRMQQARIGEGEVDADVPSLKVLDQLEAMLLAARMRPTAGLDARELDQVKAVAIRYPYGSVLSNAALAFGLNGRADDASLMLRIICHRHHPRYCEETLRHWLEVQVPEHPALEAVELPAPDERVMLPPPFL